MKKIYALLLFASIFSSSAFSQTIIPVGDELILPQYAYYGGTRNATRIPFVCRLKLTGLTPGATYRYMPGMSTVNNLTTSQSPGHMYRINNGISAAGYGYITGMGVTKAINSTELNFDTIVTSNSSRHGRFTADGSGSYTGWFACVPTGGATHQPLGSNVYFYVHLNDGGTGTTLASSYRTTSTIKLLNYTNTPGDPTGCTALLGASDVGGEKFVATFDNTGATGRPLYCTFTEDNNCGAACTPQGGMKEGTYLFTYAPIYPAVDNVSGSWASIIPNAVTGGVQAINFYNIDGSLMTLSNAPNPNTSPDGTWNGVSTANAAGDSSAPIVINSIAGAGPLPVKLLSFGGSRLLDGIQLQWVTGDESKNLHFDILRAGKDGRFNAIGQVKAVANPTNFNRYEFLDARPLSGKNLYQLKQVDQNGATTLSKVIIIDNQNSKVWLRVIAQNTNEMTVGITAKMATTGNLTFSDALGRIIYSKQLKLAVGDNAINIPALQDLKQMGVLNLTTAEGERVNLKLVR